MDGSLACRLPEDGSEGAMQEAAIYMLGSHDSYSKCGLGSKETDLLVSDATAHPAVFGAKITGGGSGGTVCILCRADAEERVAKSIADQYPDAHRHRTAYHPRHVPRRLGNGCARDKPSLRAYQTQ
jgi:galactokinase